MWTTGKTSSASHRTARDILYLQYSCERRKRCVLFQAAITFSKIQDYEVNIFDKRGIEKPTEQLNDNVSPHMVVWMWMVTNIVGPTDYFKRCLIMYTTLLMCGLSAYCCFMLFVPICTCLWHDMYLPPIIKPGFLCRRYSVKYRIDTKMWWREFKMLCEDSWPFRMTEIQVKPSFGCHTMLISPQVHVCATTVTCLDAMFKKSPVGEKLLLEGTLVF